MKPLIVDNFLDPTEFNNLQNIILSPMIKWEYVPSIVNEDDGDKFQFVHVFYMVNDNGLKFISKLGEYPTLDFLNPLLNLIKPKELFRIKANILARTSEIEPNVFHTDIGGNMGIIPYTTSIFYINSNDGYTEFEDGTKIESVANRLISFPEEMKHRGTSCTDEKIRVVINFNYLT